MTWRHIMFAVDLSSAVSPGVLSKVAHLAHSFDAEVELCHCVFDWHPVRAGRRIGSVRSGQEIRAIVARSKQQLDLVARRLSEAGVRARTAVRWDYPAYEGIIRQVLRHKPDVLIAQTTRHTRPERLMLTHTDYKLIEACPCPLLLIKSNRPYIDTCIVAAVDPMHTHDRPAALDHAILESASALSQGIGVALHVYNARAPWAEAVQHSPVLRSLPEAVYAEVYAAYEGNAAARVKELARFHKIANSRVHLAWGDPSEGLPEFANSVSAGVVAMGAVSRSAVQRAFIGHTAERVLDALSCDVLVVKPPGFRSPVGRESVHRLPKGLPGAKYVW